jgi:hypothetical protein
MPVTIFIIDSDRILRSPLYVRGSYIIRATLRRAIFPRYLLLLGVLRKSVHANVPGMIPIIIGAFAESSHSAVQFENR